MNFSQRPGNQPEYKPFSSAVFLTELERKIDTDKLVSKFILLEKFFYHLRNLRTLRYQDAASEIAVLSSELKSKGTYFGWKEQLISALKYLLTFHGLKVRIKNEENRNLLDEDLTDNGLTNDGFVNAAFQIARYLAWKEDLQLPQGIIDAYSEASKPGISTDEISRVTLDMLAENNAQRSPIIFIVDTSFPMSSYLDEVSDSLNEMFDLINDTPVLRKGAEIAIVTTTSRPQGHASLLFDFTDIESAQSKVFGLEFDAFGPAHIDEAIEIAIDALDRYPERLKQERQTFTAPWIVLISAGKWIRTSSLNTRLDDCIATLKERSNKQSGHDFELHTISPREVSKLPADMQANIMALPGEKYTQGSVKGVFRDIFKSIKIARSKPPKNELTLKSAGTL